MFGKSTLVATGTVWSRPAQVRTPAPARSERRACRYLFADMNLLHGQLESRQPALLHLGIRSPRRRHPDLQLPAAAVGLRLPLFRLAVGGTQRVALAGDGAAAETAGDLEYRY